MLDVFPLRFRGSQQEKVFSGNSLPEERVPRHAGRSEFAAIGLIARRSAQLSLPWAGRASPSVTGDACAPRLVALRPMALPLPEGEGVG